SVDKEGLINGKSGLEESVDNEGSSTGMSEGRIENYKGKGEKGEEVIENGNKIIEKAEGSVEEVCDEKCKVEEGVRELKNGKSGLRGDKE
ncbi:hypothetical protein, partial [Staphylococcus epidermidis]|uniref:hypothetical protein n=1 Tax=Staphylococcus epidermidis TaxID=1282 RepID=UPI00164317EE